MLLRAPLLLIFPFLLIAAAAVAQGVPEVDLGVVKEAYQKTDVLVGTLDVLSGGMRSVDMATASSSETIAQDLEFSGLFRVALLESQAERDSLRRAVRDAGKRRGAPARCDGDGRGEAHHRESRSGDPPRGPAVAQQALPTAAGPGAGDGPPFRQPDRRHAHRRAVGIAMTRVVFSRGSGDRRDLWVVDSRWRGADAPDEQPHAEPLSGLET